MRGKGFICFQQRRMNRRQAVDQMPTPKMAVVNDSNLNAPSLISLKLVIHLHKKLHQNNHDYY